MKRIRILFTLLVSGLLLLSGFNYPQTHSRKEILVPDILGYKTLKCDFHLHTVFSDGYVWPTARVDEAWQEGLDVIAISDHIEYLPHKEEILPGKFDFNRSYELAKKRADRLSILLIKAGEITRDLPPGHWNAVFLDDVNRLDRPEFEDTLREAVDQKAFVFWNHPSYEHPEDRCEWFPIHEKMFQKGWMHGIEVANGDYYYPEVFRWCLEKKLTLLGNSDIHSPVHMSYRIHKGEHRPMTLVFAGERSLSAVRDALFKRRTTVLWKNTLIGEKKYLEPLVKNAIRILNPEITLTGRNSNYIHIKNLSDIPYQLVSNRERNDLAWSKKITLHQNRTVLLRVRAKGSDLSKKEAIEIPFKVKNAWTAPDECLTITLPVTIRFLPEK